jgi:hypothetical protein
MESDGSIVDSSAWIQSAEIMHNVNTISVRLSATANLVVFKNAICLLAPKVFSLFFINSSFFYTPK